MHTVEGIWYRDGLSNQLGQEDKCCAGRGHGGGPAQKRGRQSDGGSPVETALRSLNCGYVKGNAGLEVKHLAANSTKTEPVYVFLILHCL